MTNYQRGTRLERLARDSLRRNGYTVVRSAGSKGKIDLVAWNGECVRMIQVKAKGALSAKEIEALRALPCPPCGTIETWERMDDGSFDVTIELRGTPS